MAELYKKNEWKKTVLKLQTLKDFGVFGKTL